MTHIYFIVKQSTHLSSFVYNCKIVVIYTCGAENFCAQKIQCSKYDVGGSKNALLYANFLGHAFSNFCASIFLFLKHDVY